jgi:GPH family glycoside/pentoside/hexuronide:cation symporter
VATPLIVQAGGGSNTGYALAALLVGAAGTVFLLMTGLGVREAHAVPAVSTRGLHSYRTAVSGLVSHARAVKPLQRLLWIMISATLGYAMFAGAVLFFIEARPALTDFAALLLAAPTLASLVMAPVWPLVAKRSSKRVAMMSGAIIAGAGFAGVSLAPGPMMTLTALVIAGAGLAAIPVMLWSMAADVVDYGHLQTGERVEARVFGLFTLTQKIASGLALLCVAGGLAVIGQGVEPGIGPAWGLALLVSVLPSGFIGLTAVLASGYQIDHDAHARIVETLTKKPPTR